MTHSAENRRGPWNINEDNVLRNLIAIHGAQNWVRIAHGMYGRTAKQCRERYHQKLKDGLCGDPLSPEEEKFILLKIDEIGKKWAHIARLLGNRSDNQIKNWYNGYINKTRDRRASRNRHRSRSPRPAPVQQSLPTFEAPRAVPPGPPPVPAHHHQSHWDSRPRQWDAPHLHNVSGYYSSQSQPLQHYSTLPSIQRDENLERLRPQPLDLRTTSFRQWNGPDQLPSPNQILQAERDGPPSLVSETSRSPSERSPQTPAMSSYSAIQLPPSIMSPHPASSAWSAPTEGKTPVLPLPTPPATHSRSYSGSNGAIQPRTPPAIDPDLQPLGQHSVSRTSPLQTSSTLPPLEHYLKGGSMSHKLSPSQPSESRPRSHEDYFSGAMTSSQYSPLQSSPAQSNHSRDSSRRGMDINNLISH